MSSIDKFKQIIKECVREVLQEELKNFKPIIKENNSKPKPVLPPNLSNESTGNIMLDMLNETKNSMALEEYNDIEYNTNIPIDNIEGEIPPSFIPNYSEIMSKMNDK